MSLRRDLRFNEQNIIPVHRPDIQGLPHIDNIIYKTKIPELKWIEILTHKIGEWRDIFSSTYIRWALSLNGLHIAAEKYRSPDFNGVKSFHVTGLRTNVKKGAMERIKLVEWGGEAAADAHMQTINMIASYGIIDLFSCIEEFVFDFYRSYLNDHPGQFIVGPEPMNKALRILYNNREAEPDKWAEAWKERLDSWQRKRIYDGIHAVFLSFMTTAGLEKPTSYTMTTVESWSETIRLVAVLRNALMHGEKNVPKELADLSKKQHGLSFNFNEGDPINLSTLHLMGVECFLDQLCTALNLSLVEKGEKEYQTWEAKQTEKKV